MQSDESGIGPTLLGFPIILGRLANADPRGLSSVGLPVSILYIAISHVFGDIFTIPVELFQCYTGTMHYFYYLISVERKKMTVIKVLFIWAHTLLLRGLYTLKKACFDHGLLCIVLHSIFSYMLMSYEAYAVNGSA